MLLSLLSVFNNDLERAVIKNNNAATNLSQATVKLYSIVNAGTEILSAYQRYEEILAKPAEENCIIKNELITHIREVAAQYNLSDSLKIMLTYPNAEDTLKTNQIRINNYDIKLQFKARDFVDFKNFIQNIYNLMPANSVIVDLEAERKEVVDLEIAKTLAPDKMQNFIYSKLHIRIREIAQGK